MINLNNLKNIYIHFIGIGGISMSALALFCEKFGAIVTGSDLVESEETKKLINHGVVVYDNHNKTNITDYINFVVYSGAIKEDNEELLRARELHIPCYERSEFLGFLSSKYNYSVVVSGTHGKTTTTAMIGEIFLKNNLHPSIHLGGESVSFGNYVIGNYEYFITEGCEYRNSIKYLHPNTSVITTIELDHTDCYRDYDEIESAFLNLANNTKQNVVVFENLSFANKINSKVRVINVGFGKEYEIRGENLTPLPNGCYSFDVYYNGYMGKFQANAVGIHNAKNTLCAIAVALLYDIDISTIYSSLRNFAGVKRRFEKVGMVNNVPIICDYAHHPTEIINSINTAKNIYGEITVVFQPHTYSRTIGLKSEFKKSFKLADNLAIFKTYPAREKYIAGGSAKELYNDIKHINKTYLENKKALKNYISQVNTQCVLVLGAGDIYSHIVKLCKNK